MTDCIVRVNPARPAEVVGEVPAASMATVAAAVTAAEGARREWWDAGVAARIDAVQAAASTVAARTGELGELLARELGKPRADAEGELRFAQAFVAHCAAHAAEAHADVVIDTGAAGGHLRITQQPFGTVAAITPWNAPVILAALKVVPALLAGNAVVVKPSPLVPLAVTAVLGELAAGLPAGVLAVCNGGVEVGRALVRDPRIRKVGFTGGDAAAVALLRDLAEGLVPAVLELGGNDPAIVCADADLSTEAVERLVLASFLTSGQVCMAAKRVYVHRSRLEELTERYLEVARSALVMGDPLDPAVTVGPLASATQRDRVSALIDAARRAPGATVVELGTVTEAAMTGGGWFVRPMLVLGLGDEHELVREEQFGPVVPLLGFDDEDDAVRRANDSPLGLAASVWSADEERAVALARRLECGHVSINVANRGGMHLRAPFGGVKRSGYGREYGDDAVAHWLQPRSIHAPAPVPARAYPADAASPEASPATPAPRTGAPRTGALPPAEEEGT